MINVWACSLNLPCNKKLVKIQISKYMYCTFFLYLKYTSLEACLKVACKSDDLRAAISAAIFFEL